MELLIWSLRTRKIIFNSNKLLVGGKKKVLRGLRFLRLQVQFEYIFYRKIWCSERNSSFFKLIFFLKIIV